jgi:hypothetical protein
MAVLTSSLILQLVDRVTGPAGKVVRSLRAVSRAAGDGFGMGTMGQKLGKNIDDIARRHERATRVIRQGANELSRLTFPLAAAGYFAAEAVYGYEKVGNRMEAVGELSDEQREKLEAHAKEINKLFPQTNKGILESAAELLKAGFTFEQTMGLLKGTLQLAFAGEIEPKEAADISSNILRGMGLPMKTAEQAQASMQRVNDVLAKAAVDSNTDITKLAQTFKYVAPIGSTFGMTLEEIAAGAMLMANNGIKASEAGVAMRSGIVRMIRPTKPMLAALARLNINLDDFIKKGREIKGDELIRALQADGIDARAFGPQIDKILADSILQKNPARMTAALTELISKGLGSDSLIDKDVLSQAITDSLTGLGSEVDFFGFIKKLRDTPGGVDLIAHIFDVRQGSRLLTLLRGDFEGFLRDLQQNSKGAAAKMSETMLKGIVGQWQGFTAGVENFLLAVANSGVLADIGSVLTSIANGMNRLAEVSPILLRIATWAAGITAVLGALSPFLLGLGRILLGLMRIVSIVAQFAALRIVVAGLVTVIAALGAPLAAIIAGLALAGTAIWYFWDEIKQFFSWLGQLAVRAGNAIASGVSSLYEKGAQLLQSFWDGMKSIGAKLLAWAKSIGSSIASAFTFDIKLPSLMGGKGGVVPRPDGARAKGGYVRRGGIFEVGEEGPELFESPRNGHISPNGSYGGAAGGHGPIGATLNANFSVNADNIREVAQRAVEELMAGLDRALTRSRQLSMQDRPVYG